MLGAIIGDIVGSIYEVLEVKCYKELGINRNYEERIKILDKNIGLFSEGSCCTDDSILTCAIADAIINGNCQYEKYLKQYGKSEVNVGVDKYGRSRFGSGFISWLNEESTGESYGNGAAMRVGPVGYLFNTLDEVIENSKLATIPSHNHIDAIKGAEAIAVTIFLLRMGYTKDYVYKYVVENYYELNYDLKDLQMNNIFSSKSDITVPQALFIFFQSCDFEDAIRKAISIGGDSDTIACIVGSISEAYYGIPDLLIEQSKKYLPDYMKIIKDNFYEIIEVIKS